VLWMDPRKEAPKWSRDEGLVVKRKGNPKESTIEAHGLVQGMPTGRHFKIRVYDDVIDEEHVTNPDMIRKATQQWELSLNLGSTQPVRQYKEIDIERYVGTRYHYNDPYATILKRKAATPRIYPGTDNGKPDGEPVLWTPEVMANKRKKMGPYVFGCQILQDPKADEVQGFKEEWLKFWKPRGWDEMITFLLCDPAGEKKLDNDYTVMWVIGLGEDQNYYVIDGLRDRLNLSERTKAMFKFHRRYRPLGVGYEKYGKDSDIEHIEDQMERKQYRFHITTLGGQTPKNDRIRKLIPLFEQGRVYIPNRLIYIDREKKQHDLTQEFIDDEFKAFPVAEHDDMLDCLARILHPDLDAEFPMKDDGDLDDIDYSDEDLQDIAEREGFIV
jgi:predicted phage terminase large subunit-like protein